MNLEGYSKSIDAFINILDKFDYLNTDDIKKQSIALKSIPVLDMFNELKLYYNDFVKIEKGVGLKNNSFKFLNSIKFFDTYRFNAENKNTKKSIVKYLVEIYFSCLPLVPLTTNNSSELIMARLANTNDTNDSTHNLGENIKNMIESNDDLKKITDKMIGKFEQAQINPAELLSSLLNGNTDNKLFTELAQELQGDIKDMNKDKFQETASNIISSVSNLIPGVDLTTLLAGMNKKL